MKIFASTFHPMRGHVMDGANLIFCDKSTAELKSVMNGWTLIDQAGAQLFSPVSSAHELTRNILEIDLARAAA